MKPVKPRPPGSFHDTLVSVIGAIALGLGYPREAGPKLVANALGVSAALVHAWTDPDKSEEISFIRVQQLYRLWPREVQALYDLPQAEQGVVAVPTRDEGDAITGHLAIGLLEHAGDLSVEVGEAITVIGKAIRASRPGGSDVTPEEIPVLRREVFDVLRVVTRIYSALPEPTDAV